MINPLDFLEAIFKVYKPEFVIKRNALEEGLKHEQIALVDLKIDLLKKVIQDKEFTKNPGALIVLQQVAQGANLSQIIEKSIELLTNEKTQGIIEDDWCNQFFDKAKLISNEETQQIWAKILTEEYYHPGTISIKTLNILSQLTKKIGSIFENFCGMCINQKAVLCLSDNNELNIGGIPEEDIDELRYFDLVHDWNLSGWDFRDPQKLTVDYAGGIKLTIISKGISGSIPIIGGYWFKLTSSGVELCKIINAQPNLKYLAYLVDHLERQKMEVSVVGLSNDISLKEFIIPLEIVSAIYGSERKKIDVTEYLQSMIVNNSITVIANNDLAGDPDPGADKYLNISYKIREVQRGVQVSEGHSHTISA